MKNFGWIQCSKKMIGFFHACRQNSMRSLWKYENHQDLFKTDKKYCQILIRQKKRKYLE